MPEYSASEDGWGSELTEKRNDNKLPDIQVFLEMAKTLTEFSDTARELSLRLGLFSIV